eukprot:6195240-Pleurochrysis_carterae.AAC.2
MSFTIAPFPSRHPAAISATNARGSLAHSRSACTFVLPRRQTASEMHGATRLFTGVSRFVTVFTRSKAHRRSSTTS